MRSYPPWQCNKSKPIQQPEIKGDELPSLKLRESRITDPSLTTGRGPRLKDVTNENTDSSGGNGTFDAQSDNHSLRHHCRRSDRSGNRRCDWRGHRLWRQKRRTDRWWSWSGCWRGLRHCLLATKLEVFPLSSDGGLGIIALTITQISRMPRPPGDWRNSGAHN